MLTSVRDWSFISNTSWLAVHTALGRLYSTPYPTLRSPQKPTRSISLCYQTITRRARRYESYETSPLLRREPMPRTRASLRKFEHALIEKRDPSSTHDTTPHALLREQLKSLQYCSHAKWELKIHYEVLTVMSRTTTPLVTESLLFMPNTTLLLSSDTAKPAMFPRT